MDRVLVAPEPAAEVVGQAPDVEALDRPRNRARPFVRLVDARGRRWSQGESAVYPSSAWRPGERAVGVARIELDPTLPPGEYRLEGGFRAGSGQARLTEDGPWGSAGLMARVHWPLLKRSTAAAALLVFVDVMKELPATMVLRPFNSDTLAVVAYQLARDERLGEAALPSLALVAVGLVPVILLSRTLRSKG